jgi:divalent metal cation (Fe/Co/Zn/Cd) transporter
VVIGLILGVTALLLANESKGLLIGEAADPDLVRSIHDLACDKDGIVGVGYILTNHSSPDQITVMMNVDFRDNLLASDVERIGLRVDDIVVGFNGRPLTDSADMVRSLLEWETAAGTRLTVYRDGDYVELALD